MLENPYTLEKRQAEQTRLIIRGILHTAAASGFTELVLGALGCGAFRSHFCSLEILIVKKSSTAYCKTVRRRNFYV